MGRKDSFPKFTVALNDPSTRVVVVLFAVDGRNMILLRIRALFSEIEL